MGNCQTNLAVYVNPTSSGQALDILNVSKPSSVDKVRNGDTAKVVGRVIQTDVIFAPLTGRPCVYYDVTLEINVDGKWVGLALEAECSDFFLTSAHSCPVYVCASSNGILACALDSTMVSIDLSLGTELSKRAAQFCSKHNVQRSGVLKNPYGRIVLLDHTRIRATECIVPIDATVETFGYVINDSLFSAPSAISVQEAKRLGWKLYEKKLWKTLCLKAPRPRILLTLSQSSEALSECFDDSNQLLAPLVDVEIFYPDDEEQKAGPEDACYFQPNKMPAATATEYRNAHWYYSSFST